MSPAEFHLRRGTVAPVATRASLPRVASNFFRICSYKIPHSKPFGICTCKTKNLKSRRISSYKKTYTYSPSPRANPCRQIAPRLSPFSKSSILHSIAEFPFSLASLRSSPPIPRCSPAISRHSLSPSCIQPHLSQNRSQSYRPVEETAKLVPARTAANPTAQPLFLANPDQTKTLTLLYDISRELTSILDREALFRGIAQHVKKIVDYHVFTVMLWNERTQLLEGVFAMHYEDTIASRFRVPLGEGITGSAAAGRVPIRIPDVRLDARYIHCQTADGVRSELVVPLLMQDRLIGVLDLESTEPHAFTEEHERLLSTLAAFIAIALENSRLYQDARQNELRLLAELDTAKEIQRQLLPRGAREVPGLDIAASYVPARELGGDFYDFLPYGNGRLAFVLGDVSGKGTPAALYGSLAIGILREHVVDHPCPPAEMLQMLNGRLYAARLDARFVAMSFALYDAATREMTIASAGAPHPWLVRDGKVEELIIEGVPLGLLPEIEYEILKVNLLPGDLLVFASDGFVESENPQHEEFGNERLSALLSRFSQKDSVEDISGALLLATDEFSGSAPAHDDRTLLVLRVREEVSPADYARMPVIY